MISVLIFCGQIPGQSFSLNIGTTVSTLEWRFDQDKSPHYQNVLGFALFLDTKHMEKDFLSLGSRLGFYQIGGEEEPRQNFAHTLIQQNTNMMNVSYSGNMSIHGPLSEYFEWIFSIGPRMDYTIETSENLEKSVDQNSINTLRLGLTTDIGVMMNLSSRLRMGIRAGKLWSFQNLVDKSRLVQSSFISLSDETYWIGLSTDFLLP